MMKRLTLIALLMLAVVGMTSCNRFNENEANDLIDMFQDDPESLTKDDWIDVCKNTTALANELEKEFEDALDESSKRDQEKDATEVFESEEFVTFLKLAAMVGYLEDSDMCTGKVKDAFKDADRAGSACGKKIDRLMKFEDCEEAFGEASQEVEKWVSKVKMSEKD